MPLVYLAGGIAGLSFFQATQWRKQVKAELASYGIGVLDPMRGISSDLYYSPQMREVVCQRKILHRDRLDVARCDAMLACLIGPEGFDRVSIGTMIEFGWANAWGKPIVAVIEDTTNQHSHPFITELAAWIVPSIAYTMPIFQDMFGDLSYKFAGAT